jgi:hypothetical protein
MAEWALAALALAAAGLGAPAAIAGAAVTPSTLTVNLAGTGAGSVTSDPAGITCSGAACTGSFDPTTSVVLTAVPAAGNGFGGFTGACTATTTFTCTVSLAADATVTATFEAPPVLTVTAPADAAGYPGASVPVAAFICPGATCSVIVDGGAPIASGDPLPPAPGTHRFVVTATAPDGGSAAQSGTYTVNPPPTCSDVAATTKEGAPAQVRLSCSDPNAPVTYAINAQPRHGTLGRPRRVMTYTPDAGFAGTDSFTYHATSADGASATHRATITVLPPPTAPITSPTVQKSAPTAHIAAPVDNAAYLWTALPAADFTCLPGAGSTIQSCTATVGGQPISDHQSLPNAFGAHVLTVTATDADGVSAAVSATYTVTVSAASLPPVSIQAPAQGARYRLGHAVAARYSCAATATGPALESCVGTVPAGHRINTRTLGAHSFSVSATNDQGESTTETVTYKVVPTTNRFVVVRLRAAASGEARLGLNLPGPGSVRVVATAWNAAAGASGRHLSYGTASQGARRGGPLELVLEPTPAGRALLGTRGARPVIALTVTYKPTGARPRVVRPKPLHLS